VDARNQHALIRLLDQELDKVKSTFQDAWTPELDLRLDAAKLYLYAFCYLTHSPLVEDIPGASSIMVSFNQLLLQGFCAACRIIDTFSGLAFVEEDTTPSLHVSNEHFGRLLYYPKPLYTNLFFATVFLLQFLTAQRHASQTDRDFAIDHVTKAHHIFSQFRASREHKRAALLIEVLARLTRSGGGHAEPMTKARLGASIQHSQTFLAAQARKRSIDPNTGHAELFEWSDLGGLPPGKHPLGA
jgi:hypothetical protein